MRIATWNVNSIRAREDVVLNWVEEHDPDILCMQETKITDQEFPEDAFGDLDYDVEYFGQPAYNGVAIASKSELTNVVKGFPDDGEDADKRVIAATIDEVRIINMYLPNGKSLTSQSYKFKLAFIERLRAFLDSYATEPRSVVLCGDFNIAPLDIDVYNPEERAGQLFVSEPERRGFQSLLDFGLTDSFRHFHPDEPKSFSWWDYRGGGWERNRGMRIDHLLVSKDLLDAASGVEIHRKVRGEENPSDHVPVVIDVEL